MRMMMMSNSSLSPMELLTGNGSSMQPGGAVAFPKDSFTNAMTKNIVAMLVWLVLNVINGTMVYTTRSTPLILAGMSVERYLSICYPMHYGHICTVRRTFILIWVILLLTAAPPLTDLFITLAKEPPEFFSSSMFCDHSLLFRDRSIYYKNCVFDGSYLSFVALTLLYTYCKIMMAAQAASTTLASVKRARNTVLLHGAQLMLCLLAFVVPSLQASLITQFPHLSLEIRYVFFLLVYIIPRFLSPIIYGFRDENFRRYWIRYLTCRAGRAGRVRPLPIKVTPKVK